MRFPIARLGLLVFFFLAGGLPLLIDDRHGPLFAGIAGLFCILFAVRPPRAFARTRTLVFTALLGWLATVGVVEWILPPRCHPENIQAGAAPVIAQLEEYRRTHGTYPPSLEAAGIHPPRYRCGTFQYHLDPDGTCGLRIGDYSMDHITAWWNSEDREWTFDS